MKFYYRPEIDGLRAIAVGAVILYHANFTILGHQPFKGGFIGVDIFFVISGYLITSIILNELFSTGSFSIKYFYERRIRRILPVLLVVILASLPFAWLYISPVGVINFAKTIIYTLGFASNFYFYLSDIEYFAGGAPNAFLHTWSLSVEEQYYILFPLVTLVIFKYFRNYLVYVLIILFLISLSLAEWSSRNHPSASFYFLHTRMWELLAGSILAYFEIKLGHRSKNKTLNTFLPIIGLLLILHSFLIFSDEMVHPSFYTLSPIIGVCLIIWFSSRDELVTKLISTKLFVGIGLISYSLYLWHYPIFVLNIFAKFTEGDLLKKLFIFVIIFLLSITTYYFVERPSRNRNISFKKILLYILIFLIFLIIVSTSIITNQGFKNRLPNVLKDYNSNPWLKLKNLNGEICFDKIDGCFFNQSSKTKVYLIGDSIAGSLNYDLKNRLIENNYQFINYTLNSCLYFPGFNRYSSRNDKIDKKCNDEYFQKIKQKLIIEKNSIIIFTGKEYFLDNKIKINNEKFIGDLFVANKNYETLDESFLTEVTRLAENNKIILVYPMPNMKKNIPENIFLKIKKNHDKKKNDLIELYNIEIKEYENENQKTIETFNALKSINIFRVYPHKLFCDTYISQKCVNNDGENIFYADSYHPSLKGAEMINNSIIKEIGKIENKEN